VVEECHVRPESLTRGLREACIQRGVNILEQTEVQRLVACSDSVGVQTADGLLQPTAVLVAAGVWTRPLVETVSIGIPIESAKGYSITVSGEPAVRRALYLTEARIGVSPYKDATRVAGTLELTGLDTSVDHRRIKMLTDMTRRYLPGWSTTEGATTWSGLRPLAPDGLPVIGACSAYHNLFTATGHGMLGVTLAPVTGEALAPVVLGEPASDVLAPFTPDRFDGRQGVRGHRFRTRSARGNHA
jgi:D-amino-acid dehydrogenase